MTFDPLLLSRIQFGFTVSFHIIFPVFTIGLSGFIATLLVMWQWTKKEHFQTLARFWTKIFAVSFAMGVVSGIVLSYQFGTNWSHFSEVVGNVVGPVIGYEVLTAFFLEATFLGVMLFGWKRVPPWLHTLSAILVAVGTCMSGFWILSANSWMQTPAGHEVIDGIAYPKDWFAIVFNPSFPYRFMHMMTGAYLTTSVVVLAVGARYLLVQRFVEEAKTMVRMGLGMVILLAPLQAYIGDLHGLNTAKYQPTKLAAIEAHWDGSTPADLVLFAIPDAKLEKNLYEIAIPKLGSLIVTHQWDGLFPGLLDVPKEDRPPLLSVFFSFRIMVGIGLFLIALGLLGGLLWLTKHLFTNRFFLWTAGHSWPLGFVAILAGWMVTESGRQPWIAHGILRTADAVSPVDGLSVAISLALFVFVYSVVFSTGILYIRKMIKKGPTGAAIAPKPDDGAAALPNRPLSAAQDSARESFEGGAVI
ncbi:MAG: cytochrome ubiquinol oxidase subunit I [Candidatus Berkiella sp.]